VDAWEANELRASVGLSFKWQAPVGPIVVNVAAPIKKKDGDRTETLQFSFGNTF
jgi:outer membrane protein insertion porin family